MDKSVKKIILWSLVATTLVIGTVILVNKLKKPKEDPEDEAKGAIEGSNFNSNKTVKLGSTGNEVGAIKIAFNNIIKDLKRISALDYCKKTIQNGNALIDCIESKATWYRQANAEEVYECVKSIGGDEMKKAAEECKRKEARRKDIAAKALLVQDQNFDKTTENMALLLMGTKTFSYADVKQKRKDFAFAYGLKNPYEK